MTAIVIEHVPVASLPAAWRAQLTQASGATVRIEQVAQTAALNRADAQASPCHRGGCAEQ